MAEKRCVFKCGAWNCGSYQFNLHQDDIDQGELCDVHYWQTKAQRPWVGLTPEEVKHLYPYGRSVWGKETFEAIEKALRSKNT